MITYTKKNVDLITLLITLTFCLILNLVMLYFISVQQNANSYLNSKTYPYNKVYKKTIPIIQTISYAQTFNPNISEGLIQKTNFQILSQINEKEKTTIGQVQTMPAKEEKIQAEIAKQEDSSDQTQREIVNENKKSDWRIIIPKLNLDVHIKEGISTGTLLQAVGHFEQTSKWNGNVGLAAHNRGYRCNFFEKIKNLKIGDEIIYKSEKGKKVYKVQTNKIIPETNWSYLKQTQDNRITLITCVENRKEYRRCVQAVEIANYNNQ